MDRLEWNDFPPEEEKEKTSFGQVLSRCISLRRLFLRSFSLDWFYSYLKEEGSTSDNSTRCVSSTLKKEDFLLELVRLNKKHSRPLNTTRVIFFTLMNILVSSCCKSVIYLKKVVCSSYWKQVQKLIHILIRNMMGLTGYLSEFTNLERLEIDCLIMDLVWLSARILNLI